MRKTFCILEQGKVLNESITREKRRLFTTDFSDFYRLNWFHDQDENAFLTAKNITWSEGRSLLYEKVPKEYDYYIFIDDDITFCADQNIYIPGKIKQLLEEYRPISGTFYCPTQWSFSRTGISHSSYRRRKVFPIFGYDMAAQIFAADFADVMFPAIYHGAHRTLWYPQWVCSQRFPTKQMAFSEIRVKGHRSGGHSKSKAKQHYEPTEVMYLFNRDVKKQSSVIKIKEEVIDRNIAAFRWDVDKTPHAFQLSDLAAVYNINNPDFKCRASLASPQYMHRKPWNHFWFRATRKLTGEYRYGSSAQEQCLVTTPSWVKAEKPVLVQAGR